jgi:hypothetical protein
MGQRLVIIINQSDASVQAIFGVAHFSGIITHKIFLIKGGLICQKNVGTVTLRWGGDLYAGGTYSEGGTYMLVYTVYYGSLV